MQALFSRRRNFVENSSRWKIYTTIAPRGKTGSGKGNAPGLEVGHRSDVIGVTEKARLLHFNAPQDDRGAIEFCYQNNSLNGN
jgi:hypothetical protein